MAATLVDGRGHPIPQTGPGLIVLPNIDVDGRRLPAAVEPATDRRIRLDHELQVKSARDDDLIPVGIRLDAATDPAHAEVSLRIEGPLQEQFNILDVRKHPIRKHHPFIRSGAAAFTLALAGSRSATVFLETAALAGTPLVRSTGDQTQLVLVVDGVDQYRVTLSIAPFLLESNLGSAERIYICEIEHSDASNVPSLSEVEAALARTGVAIVKIPMEINLGDAWIQDQIQTGFCHTPGGIERVILHLPRSRSNVIHTGPLVNLKFFARQHFPSRNFGLFDDFWRRPIGRIEDDRGGSEPLLFENSFEIHLRLESVNQAWRSMSEAFDIYSRRAQVSDPTLSFIFAQLRKGAMGFVKLRRTLPGVLRMLERFFARVSRRLGADLLARQLEVDRALVREHVQTAINSVMIVMSAGGERLRIKRKDQPAALLNPVGIDDMVDRLTLMHDSLNYGGNIEASPPVAGAPLGKVVVGSSSSREIDPQLAAFFFEQRVQPVVFIDTSWLGVAHVDEIMTFVPSSSGGAAAAFAIPFASPSKAIQILKVAREIELESLRKGIDLQDFFLTSMLRGKYWLYQYPEQGFEVTRPPFIHRQYHLGNYSEPGRGHTQQYHAGVSVRLLLEEVGLATNGVIQSEFIKPLVDEILRVEFDGIELIPLPVLFDEVPSTEAQIEPASIVTSAYTPNLVNLQVIDQVLLIPKPYGPRMGVQGAIETLKLCLDSRLHSQLTEDYFKRSGLLDVFHWDQGTAATPQPEDAFEGVGPDDPLGTQGLELRPPPTDLERIARQFNDGFLEGQLLIDEKIVQRKIQEANRAHFDAGGRLRPGWHRLRIPERSVDLFEAFTRIQLEALGNLVHFVDTWYYHVRHGEIHCGTNVLRKPEVAVKWWETLPDAEL